MYDDYGWWDDELAFDPRYDGYDGPMYYHRDFDPRYDRDRRYNRFHPRFHRHHHRRRRHYMFW